MVKLSNGGAYLLGGNEIIEVSAESEALLKNKLGSKYITKEEAAKNTIAYGILEEHNTSGNMEKLQVKFDKLTSHDITFVGIIQTARASGLEKFPIPYVLTNCHNSLCAVGGTINEDDHMYGLTCAKKYGGVYVPPHQAVIHQFAREMLAGGGKMILGSDSHTRYGALGTMAVGEGGPELVKQLLNQTYDNYEYVIKDGGSKDSTIEIAKEYEDAFGGRLRIIQQKDSCMYEAMNQGIKSTKGDIIGIINSDDYYSLDTLEQVASLYEEADNELLVVIGDMERVSEKGDLIMEQKNLIE